MFQLLSWKIDKILSLIPVRCIGVVWWISNNTLLLEYLGDRYRSKNIEVSTPHKSFRFDNASMLWTLTHNMQKHKAHYPFSKIIT
jgi:tRNA A37 threonylcarbamoyltransferase TsaD